MDKIAEELARLNANMSSLGGIMIGIIIALVIIFIISDYFKK